MTRYYLIRYTSEYVVSDEQKIMAKSMKEVIDYVKKELEYLRDEYIYRVPYDCIDPKKDYERIHKRLRVSNMYVDKKDGTTKVCGKVVSVTGRPKDENTNDELLMAWISPIPVKDLRYFANFKEIEE